MAIGVKAGRMMFQRGTKAQWEASNLVLLDGELAIEADTTKIKIGDGKHKYVDLPYIEIGEIRVADLSEEDIKKITGRKGEKGDPLRFEDLNPEQKKELKGEPFRFTDLTEEQKKELKGEKGEPGTNGVKGDDGVSPTVKIIEENNGNRVTFTDKEGEKSIFIKNGEAGEAGKFDINSLSEEEKKIFKTELVNDLTTGGVDKALSAEQGKVLFQSVDKGKDLIAKALVDKNVQASKDESFGDLANKIKDIRASGGGYGVGDIIEPTKVEPITRDNYRYKFEDTIESTDGCIRFNQYGNAYANCIGAITKYSRSGNEAIADYYISDNISSWKIRFDSNNSIYITTNNSLTHKYDDRGVEVWSYGELQLHDILNIDYKNNAYIQDSDDENTITKISLNGEILWKLKGYKDCLVDYRGNLYTICNNAIRKFDTDSKLIWDNKIQGCARLLAIDSDNSLYVQKDGKIIKVNGDGDLVWENEVFRTPIFGFIARDGNLYFRVGPKNRTHKIIKYSNEGTKLLEITEITGRDTLVDTDSCVYAKNNNILEKYSKDGTKLWEIKDIGSYILGYDDCVYTWSDKTVTKYNKEGEAIANISRIGNISDIKVDKFGNLYKYNESQQLFSRYKLIKEKDVTGYKVIA